MKVILVRTTGELPEVVETPGGLQEWYRLIGCRLIDITTRSIGGKVYDIITDDEALLKPPAIPTAINTDEKPRLFGNYIVCNCNDAGEETGLTSDDIKRITRRIAKLSDAEGNEWFALCDVDYAAY